MADTKANLPKEKKTVLGIYVTAKALFLILLILAARPMYAQQAVTSAANASTTAGPKTLTDSEPVADETMDLQKKVQNPVADLISVPFQNNFNFKTGSKDEMVNVLNIQPVIPFNLNEDWNLITRTIVPIINQPSLFPGMDSAFGLGDINPSFFLSPAKPSKVIWGVGPAFTFPTATDELLGSEKYSAGPTGVFLVMDGPWVYGALANNQWSYAGWGERDFNMMLVQPFLNYNLPKGWYLTSSPIITADWVADSDNTWTVPVGGGVGKLFKLGKMPVNAQLGAYYNVERPEYGSEWQLRLQIQLLFPKSGGK
jgi:hypothetical protein